MEIPKWRPEAIERAVRLTIDATRRPPKPHWLDSLRDKGRTIGGHEYIPDPL